MSNETDLDWLARNVREWPEGKREVLACCPRNVATLIWSSVSSDAGWITKDQWLARRTELQNKPSWAEVPAEAKYMTQGSGGAWGCWSDKPAPVKEKNESGDTVEYWGGNNPLSSFNVENKMIGEALGDWRDTLEKRPEQKAFEPFVSVEDAAEAKHSKITPSKYTKTIHGVSVDVYDVLQAWGVSNPALQHLIKKALQCGQRGHKDNAQDLQDIIDSAIRAKELG